MRPRPPVRKRSPSGLKRVVKIQFVSLMGGAAGSPPGRVRKVHHRFQRAAASDFAMEIHVQDPRPGPAGRRDELSGWRVPGQRRLVEAPGHQHPAIRAVTAGGVRPIHRFRVRRVRVPLAHLARGDIHFGKRPSGAINGDLFPARMDAHGARLRGENDRLPEALPGAEIPQLQRPGAGLAGKGRPAIRCRAAHERDPRRIGRESRLRNRPARHDLRPDGLAAFHGKDSRARNVRLKVRPARRDEQSPIARKANAGIGKAGDFTAGGRFSEAPDAHEIGAVLTGGDEAIVRRNGHGVGGLLMPADHAALATSRQRPEPHGIVRAGSGEQRTVAAEIDGFEAVPMARERAHLAGALDERCAVAREEAAIGTDRLHRRPRIARSGTRLHHSAGVRVSHLDLVGEIVRDEKLAAAQKPLRRAAEMFDGWKEKALRIRERADAALLHAREEEPLAIAAELDGCGSARLGGKRHRFSRRAPRASSPVVRGPVRHARNVPDLPPGRVRRRSAGQALSRGTSSTGWRDRGARPRAARAFLR